MTGKTKEKERFDDLRFHCTEYKGKDLRKNDD